jgi:hypothetical protein
MIFMPINYKNSILPKPDEVETPEPVPEGEKTEMDKHVERYAEFYESGLFTPKKHYRFIEELQLIAVQSGIPKKALLTSMTTVCGGAEVNWVKNFRKNINLGQYGLAYSDTSHSQRRMLHVGGALLRNYVDVQLIMVQDLITKLKAGEVFDPEVAIVPNFHICKSTGGDLPQWQTSMLLGWLQKRSIQELATVIGVGPMASVGKDYGESVKEHIEDYLKIVKD